MPWAKVDDGLHASEKFAAVSLAATGLWTLCLSWALANDTQGWIDRDAADAFAGVGEFAAPNYLADELVAFGLWRKTSAGHYEFADTELFKVVVPNSDSYRAFRDEVFKRDGFACVYCGSPMNLSLDHVIPQSKGGEHTPSNLVTACRPCNSSKGAKPLEEWRGRQ